MINPAKIKYNEPKYYAPSYGSAIKVSIIKLIANDVALVKPEDAEKGRREWEKYKREKKRGRLK